MDARTGRLSANTLALHGRAVPPDALRTDARRKTATLAWGYQTVGVLTNWLVTHRDDPHDGTREWRLDATLVGTINADLLRQRPLLLAVPHKWGFWTFPVRQHVLVGTRVSATLDPPEQG